LNILKGILRWFLIAVTALVAFALLYQGWIFGHIVWWKTHNPQSTAFMASRLDGLREKNPKAALKHQWVDYGKVSVHLKRALIVSEDDTFVDHEGFNWDAMQKALEKNQKKGKVVAGGSTISQQLSKNLFLSGSRSMLRKVQEAIITVMLEAVMDKQRIFEIYLNVIEWGEGVFGAEAAAQHYYGIPAAQLSAQQAARLAAIVPRPRFYDRNRNAPWMLKKTETILARMPRAEVP
jgi:monofunctional biosynthetic peptidoglycan transglycosylase